MNNRSLQIDSVAVIIAPFNIDEYRTYVNDR